LIRVSVRYKISRIRKSKDASTKTSTVSLEHTLTSLSVEGCANNIGKDH
jgi:hypothetical protein